MGEFETSAVVAAPRQVVWDLISVQANWSRWTPARSVHLDPPGASEPDGVGAVRVMKSGPISTREEIVAYDSPEHMAHRLHGSFPVKGYEAHLHLAEHGNSTTLRWSARWEAPRRAPSRPVDWFMRRTIERIVAGIKREAERGIET